MFKNKKVKIVLATVILIVIIFGISRLFKSTESQNTVTTEKIAKGTLVTSISGSGTITSGNSTNITTAASGTISQVYVKNGDSVVQGQKIAELTLDDDAIKLRSNRWIAYLDALEAVKTAEAAQVTADIKMWNDHQAHLTALGVQTSMVSNNTNPKTSAAYTETERMVIDKTVDEAYKTFKASELKYQDYNARVSNARIKLTAALSDYNEYSPTITAPAAGIVNNLVLASGIIITNTDTGSTSTSVSAQNIGIVNNADNQFQATINLTESDITKIKADQKVNLTLDAFSDKTFTGKVLAINTAGSSTSGVTSYPVTILLDPTTVNIYTKMAVSAEIITNIYNDVLLVPSQAIQASNGTSYVTVKKDGATSSVEVTLGDTDGANTIVTSGLSEGDEVVTSLTTNSASNDNTTSAFSSSSSKSSGNSGGSIMMGGPPGM